MFFYVCSVCNNHFAALVQLYGFIHTDDDEKFYIFLYFCNFIQFVYMPNNVLNLFNSTNFVRADLFFVFSILFASFVSFLVPTYDKIFKIATYFYNKINLSQL